MRKFKNWLYTQFLPKWAKETLLVENAKLQERISELEREKEKMLSYINGLETGIKAQRRIVIHNGEVRK